MRRFTPTKVRFAKSLGTPQASPPLTDRARLDKTLRWLDSAFRAAPSSQVPEGPVPMDDDEVLRWVRAEAGRERLAWNVAKSLAFIHSFKGRRFATNGSR